MAGPRPSATAQGYSAWRPGGVASSPSATARETTDCEHQREIV